MLLIKNAKIYTMAGNTIEKGDILIEGGKIKDIGENIESSEAEIIDATGLNVLPGIVDAHSHIGVMNFATDKHVDDANEMTSPTTAHMDARYGVDLSVKDFEYSYKNGITSVAITPGSGNVICGLVFATKTYGDNIFDMTIKAPIALKVALGGNPKRTYGNLNKLPMTRMGIPEVIRDLFHKAKEYLHKKENGETLQYDGELEALIPVMKKEIPLKIHCTQYDMLTAIEIAKEFDMKFSLEHAWGAADYMDEIVESGCDINFGPVGSMRSTGECSKIDIESVVELDKRGVNVAVVTDAPILSVDSIYNHAGEVVRNGCDIDRVLKMITINPAKIMGVEDRIGSLEIGKDADIAIFKGIPAYNTNAKVMYTIINGKVVYKY